MTSTESMEGSWKLSVRKVKQERGKFGVPTYTTLEETEKIIESYEGAMEEIYTFLVAKVDEQCEEKHLHKGEMIIGIGTSGTFNHREVDKFKRDDLLKSEFLKRWAPKYGGITFSLQLRLGYFDTVYKIIMTKNA